MERATVLEILHPVEDEVTSLPTESLSSKVKTRHLVFYEVNPHLQKITLPRELLIQPLPWRVWAAVLRDG